MDPTPPRHDDLLLSRDALPAGAAPRSVGRYLLAGELGRGGMGVVWRAHDPQLRRDVALKLLLPAAGDPPEVVARRRERFLREGRAAARLRHPNVVTLHEVGEDQGRPFMVMDLVRGGSLESALEREGRLPPRRAAEVVRDVALALAHAHAQGIVHRDVKPGNVLLEEGTGRALLSDFGLARDVTGAEQRLSQSGALIGTPDYLSPEQVRGERTLGPGVDVWALGGVLYKALTGEVPFPCETLGQLLGAVLGEEPVAPRTLEPHLHPDLELIALKCLEKDPAARYPSADEVAAELGRFLAGEALAARPLGRRERALRWACRNRALALTLLISSLLIVGLGLLGLIGGLLSVQRIRHERDRAEQARAAAEEATARAETERARAGAAEAQARAAAEGLAREAAAKDQLLARALLDRGDRLREDGRYAPAAALYAASLAHGPSLGARSGLITALSHAPRAVRFSSPTVTTVLLIEHDRCLVAGTRGLLHADQLALAGFGERVWSRQGDVDATCGALDPRGGVVALGDAGGLLRLVRLEDGRELRRWSADQDARELPVAALGWSPGGEELVAACRDRPDLLRWDRDARPLAPVPAPAGVVCLSWSTSAGLVAGCRDGSVLALDPARSGAPRALARHAGPVIGLTTCLGRLISASPADGLLAPAADGGASLELPGVSALCADGPWVGAATLEGEVVQWRPSDGARRAPLRSRFLAAATALASDRGGERLILATRSAGLELFDATSGASLDSKLLLAGAPQAAFHPAGHELTLGGLGGPNGGECRWALETRGSSLRISSLQDTRLLRTWSGDGAVTLLIGTDTRVERAGRPPVSLDCPDVLAAHLSPDGERAWIACEDGSLRVHDARTGRELARPVGAGRPLVIATSPRGHLLAAHDPAGPVLLLWDTRSGKELARWPRPGPVEALAVHPSGQAVIRAAGPLATVLPVQADQPLRVLPPVSDAISALAWSPDGQLLAIATAAAEVELWTCDPTPVRQQVLGGLQAAPLALTFAPDGQRLFAASGEGEAMLWELARSQGVLTERLPAHLNAVAFDPAAARAFVGLANGQVLILDWERGQGYSIAPEPDAGPVYRLRPSPDGSRLAVIPVRGPVSVWETPRAGEVRRAGRWPPARDGAWSASGELSLVTLERRVLVCAPGAGPPRELLPAQPGAQACSLAWLPPTGSAPAALALGLRGALLVVDDSAGRELRRVDLGHRMLVDLLAAAGPGELLAGASDRFTSLTVTGGPAQSGRAEHELFDLRRIGPASDRPLLHGPGRLQTLSLSADGARAVVAVEGLAHVWDLASGQELLRLRQRPETRLLGAELAQAGASLPSGLDTPVYPAALSARGEVLASGWPLQRVRLYFLDELGALEEGPAAAARVEAETGYRAEGVEVLAVDPPLDDPRWRRPAR